MRKNPVSMEFSTLGKMLSPYSIYHVSLSLVYRYTYLHFNIPWMAKVWFVSAKKHVSFFNSASFGLKTEPKQSGNSF